MNYQDMLELLRAEVLPTMGCTEPGAVALAAASAARELPAGEPDRIDVVVNANVYKNGVAVGIPGTGETGLYIAAALGALKRSPEKLLAVLSDIRPEELALARNMVTARKIQVHVDDTKKELWVKVRVEIASEWCEVLIREKHHQVVSIEKNGEFLFDQREKNTQCAPDKRDILRAEGMTVAAMIRTVEATPAEELEFLMDGVDMNLAAAEAGIAKELGMGIGAMYERLTTRGLLASDIISYAKTLTAGAADARMSGEDVPVMSSAGSGNHGLTAILPVVAVARKMELPRESLLRAVAISHLVNVYVKIHTGSLSALCGCAVAAATGATAAISWMMGGRQWAIEAAMKNLIANLTGMICDGGKVGCALKLATAAATAVESALMANRDIVVPSTNGIIVDSIEGTIKNLGQISNPGMLVTDEVIMDVILSKPV